MILGDRNTHNITLDMDRKSLLSVIPDVQWMDMRRWSRRCRSCDPPLLEFCENMSKLNLKTQYRKECKCDWLLRKMMSFSETCIKHVSKCYRNPLLKSNLTCITAPWAIIDNEYSPGLEVLSRTRKCPSFMFLRNNSSETCKYASWAASLERVCNVTNLLLKITHESDKFTYGYYSPCILLWIV